MAEIIYTPKLPDNPLLSQAQRIGNIIVTSGQVSSDPATGVMPNGIEAQAEQCIHNLCVLLEAAGSDLSHVIKTTCFLANAGDAETFNKVYKRYFTEKPARSCFAVCFPDSRLLCEIEAIAEAK